VSYAFAKVAADIIGQGWGMPCLPDQIVAMWQSLMQHRLTPERRAAFLKHRAMSALTQFDQAQLSQAARRARAANESANLLLDDWLLKVKEAAAEELDRSQQRLTLAEEEARALAMRDRLNARRVGEPVRDVTDFQLRANRPRWFGPRKGGDPI
jgi:hypothetical protein